jgi:predicted NUDIX family NTP pyrophosphohydrolase
VWAVESDFDTTSLTSNLFEMEWPPKSGTRRSFPEVDRADWFDLVTAARKILASQAAALQYLEKRLIENG